MKRLVIIPLLLILSSGCLGFGEGYTEKAQEYTSADYTIGTYKEFIAKYNAICNVGSSIDQYNGDIERFMGMKGDPKYWTYSENNQYESMVKTKSGYVAQYNRLVSEYNTATMDKTKDWLMIASLPEHVNSYSDDEHLTNSDWIDDEILNSELLGR